MGYPEERKNKGLKVWQFATLMVLLVVMLSTMFMPAFSWNAKTMKKMAERSLTLAVVCGEVFGNVSSGVLRDIEEEINELNEMSDVQLQTQIDLAVTSFEVMTGINLSNISPLSIIMIDDSELSMMMKEADISDFGVKVSLTPIKAVFIIIYAFTLLMIIMLIVFFATNTDKKLPLIFSTVYGVICAIVFGFLRFGLMTTISKTAIKALSKVGAGLGGLFSDGLGNLVGELTTELVKPIIKPLASFLSSFYSFGFMIAMIAAILIVAVSIVALCVNEEEKVVIIDDDDEPFDPYAEERERLRKEREELLQKREEIEKKNKAVQPAAVGVVQCIKGVAIGQGFQIPADRKVVIGKSAQRANFIINEPHVSNVHCSVRYNPANGMYTIIDHSSNGTYVNGSRLQKDTPVLFAAGTIIVLANDNNQIKLG